MRWLLEGPTVPIARVTHDRTQRRWLLEGPATPHRYYANIRSKLWSGHAFVVDFCTLQPVCCENSFGLMVGPQDCGGNLIRELTGSPMVPSAPKVTLLDCRLRASNHHFHPMCPSGTSKPLKRHLELLHFWNTFSTCQVRTPTRQQCTSSHCDSHSQSLIRA